MAHSGKLVKQEKDFTETVDKELPACQELAKVIGYSLIFKVRYILINAHLLVSGWKSERGSRKFISSGKADKNGQLLLYLYP